MVSDKFIVGVNIDVFSFKVITREKTVFGNWGIDCLCFQRLPLLDAFDSI